MRLWMSYENGLTIGQKGSENGTIICDEEYLESCRITLEKTNPAPYSITCGIYGLMCHTVFASSLDEAKEKYELMKKDLKYFLDKETTEAECYAWVETFVDKW